MTKEAPLPDPKSGRMYYTAGDLAKIMAKYPEDTLVIIEGGRILEVHEVRPEGGKEYFNHGGKLYIELWRE